jgi:hypothetical protein
MFDMYRGSTPPRFPLDKGLIPVYNPPTRGGASVRNIILGTIFGLFALCFLAIIIEETFLGGRRRRKMERQLKEERHAGNPGN